MSTPSIPNEPKNFVAKIMVNIQHEVRLSVWWIVVTLTGLGLFLFFINETQSLPFAREQRIAGILILFATATVTGLLEQWRGWAGRWFIVLWLSTLCSLATVWTNLPALFALAALPLVLAFVMLGLGASIALTVGQALLLLILHTSGFATFTSLDLAIGITANGLTVGLLASLYRLWQQKILQVWHSYEQSRRLLDEARTRNETLDQTLDDLLHANRQLDLLNERLAALRLAAEDAQRTKAAFVAKVSHEFRTPLNMIIGLTDLLIEPPATYSGKLPESLYHDIEIVHRNCVHLASMIDDVLDLSQTEAGRLALRKEWVDLTEDIGSAVAAVEPLIDKKGLSLTVQVPQTLPVIYCDRTRIRQVLLNLLSNAARYTEVGKITLAVEVHTNEITISVTDSGPGIAAEDVQRIFEPFFQVASAQGRAQSGSGLGLTISKQFVEMHDGKLWVESQFGVGSTFFFTIPLTTIASPLAKADRWLNEGWLWRDRLLRQPLPSLPHRLRMILCDLTGDLLAICADADLSASIEVVECLTLVQAMEEAQNCPSHLLWINAPASELIPMVTQACIAVADTPIIATAFCTQSDLVLGKGALEYLIKPVTRADIQAALQLVGTTVERILVVDDDSETRQLLVRMVLACDDTIETIESNTGSDALTQLRSRQPDLLLLDMMLPDMNGTQLLEQKLQEPTICHIPTVIISAQDPSSHQDNSKLLIITQAGGLSFEKLLHCALDFSTMTLN